MNNELIPIIIGGFISFLLCDYGLFYLEHRKIEKQHKRHKQDIEDLFIKYLNKE